MLVPIRIRPALPVGYRQESPFVLPMHAAELPKRHSVAALGHHFHARRNVIDGGAASQLPFVPPRRSGGTSPTSAVRNVPAQAWIDLLASCM